MGKTIAISTQKGGCGKTNAAANLGVGLARQGKRVLNLDLDPQHSLTISLGVMEPDKLPITLATMMENIITEKDFDPTAGIIHHAEGVDFLPSNITLSGMEITLAPIMGRETILRQYIDMVKPGYDYVIADCPPSLGLLTVNALTAADSVIIPVIPKYLDAKGLELLLKTIVKVRRQSTEAYRVFSAQPVDGVIEILIQTSAFARTDASSGMGWYVGEYELVRTYYTRVITQDVIVMSAYILLALVSLLLFLVLPSYKATGWLSLLSLVWAVRVGLKSRKILLTLFPDHTWEFVFKTEIITSPLTILLLALVLHSVFTGALPKWLRAAIIGGSALMALSVVVLPWPTFLGHSSWTNPPIYWTLAVMLGFILFSMWRTKTRPTLSQIIILIAMGLVVFAFIWDENYYGFFSSVRTLFTVPFAITQPMMLVFTVFMLVATLLDTMRKTVQREVELAHKVEVQEKELMQSRIAVMLSQIQPHFLYNSLAAISRLCDKDPAKAKKATIEFSTYLRGNMDSLGETQLIEFEKELHHVECFLSLEKAMYGKSLNIIYNIEAKNFELPALTLQPIVENAVKHGIGKKDDGGTVTISTEETGRAYHILVSDDGVGYDTEETLNDGQSHIGINNVRQRLREQCGGSLEIKSEKGMGTNATIIIPKNYKREGAKEA